MTDTPLLRIQDLHVHFRTDAGLVRAVDGVSYDVGRGETVAVVGESGCGKSVTALAILRLVATPPGEIAGGSIEFDGEELLTATEERMRAIRGFDVAMIFQEPMTSLNPVLRIGDQVGEVLALHLGLTADEQREETVRLLQLVGIPSPERRIDEYPHQLSGGMRQRVMIAMALACRPKLLIADEPTTALDVTVQAQILDLLRRLQIELDMSMILITHDLGVVAETARRVVVMYAGLVVERATATDLFERPRHPYTAGLFRSLPRLHEEGEELEPIRGAVPDALAFPTGCRFHPRCPHAMSRCRTETPSLTERASTGGESHASACFYVDEHPGADLTRAQGARGEGPVTEPLLRVDALTKHFPVTRGVLGRVVGQVRAVDGVSFDIAPGETLGLVGESGCGKSTVGRAVLRLLEPTAGRIVFDGTDVTHLRERDLGAVRRQLQIIFQDPYSSLNPRLRVADIVGEALEVHGIATGTSVDRRVAELLRTVGLSPSWMNRYPHEFSGGQRQRIGIARAIALGPKLIVCDEAVSALDVSIQAQVLNLLIQLRREMGLAYLFIAHDLSVVRHVSHRIAVMYLGQLVELATSTQLFRAPAHPYTRALLASIPVPVPRREPRRLILHGDVPSPLNPPSGCRFHTRCPAVMDRCRSEEPRAVTVEEGHTVTCFHAVDLDAGAEWHRVLGERIEREEVRNAAQRTPATVALPPRAVHRSEDGRDGGDGADSSRVRGARRAVPASTSWPIRGPHTLLLFCLLVAIVVYGASHGGRARAARAELDALAVEIAARQQLTGGYPRTLDELGWRLFPIFERGRPLDPWGRQIRYHAPGTEGRPFDLGSLGPDGVPSKDDLGHVPVDTPKPGEHP